VIYMKNSNKGSDTNSLPLFCEMLQSVSDFNTGTGFLLKKSTF